MNNIKYVIFDLDGTLIDSNKMQNDLDVQLVHHFDKEITKENIIKERDNFFKKTKGIDIYLDYCAYLKKKYHIKMTSDEILEKRRELERKEALKIKLKDNASEFIKFLKKRGIHLALATVSRREILDIYMNENENISELIDFKNCFEVTITKDDVKYKKPNPEIYLKILEKLGVNDLTQCLVIEDSLNGVKAAKNAGLKVISIYDDYSIKDKDEINKISDYYGQNYQELMKLIGGNSYGK